MPDFVVAPGATPLDPDTVAGLIPFLTTQRELNEFEAANILEARVWAFQSRAMRASYPADDMLRTLHHRMFDKTWRWAGNYRRRDTNIGVAWEQISVDVRQLCENIVHQLAIGGSRPDVLSAEFHHRLVSIHPFPNGNGRHARLATDLLRSNQGWTAWRWGSASLESVSEVRGAYIGALRAADGGDLQPLISFAR